MKKHIIIFAALLAAVSCQIDPAAAPVGENEIVFTANLADVTRVSFDAGKMAWETGDVLRVSNGTSWEDVTLTASDITADGYTATFKTTSLTTAANYYAVYPAANCGSGFTLDGGNVVVSIPQVQTAENVFTCVATCTDAVPVFAFKHPNTVIRFTTTRDDISRIVFHSNGNQVISGALNVNPSTAESTWGTDSYNAVSCTVVGGEAFIEISPLERLTTGFTIYAYDSSDGLLGILNKNSNRLFVRNNYYSLVNPTFSSSSDYYYCNGYPYLSFDNALSAFNADDGATLVWTDNTSSSKTFTAENGVLDLNGYSHNGCFFIQNNDGGTIIVRNGTMSSTGDCFDGTPGYGSSFGGKIILENLTVNGVLWTDGHEFEIRSGTYNTIHNMYKTGSPGLVTIKGGFFNLQPVAFSYSGWNKGNYVIEGGKFKVDPRLGENITIAAGYEVISNPDDDAATYPFKVVAI